MTFALLKQLKLFKNQKKNLKREIQSSFEIKENNYIAHLKKQTISNVIIKMQQTWINYFIGDLLFGHLRVGDKLSNISFWWS